MRRSPLVPGAGATRLSANLSLQDLEALAVRVLTASRTSPENAASVAAALAAADADGIASHGVSRLPYYADQALSGKVDGFATPRVESPAASAVRVDARDGFAYPAIAAGVARGCRQARETGVAVVAVANSHHCGAGSVHVEPPAEQGLLCIGFTNTPAGIAPWGGVRGSFGTNPIAFACPRDGRAPLVVDLSLSAVARGKVMLAAGRGEPIPEGWALDAGGNPTTDANAALAGTMAPAGGAKGAALALMVEILTGALGASSLAFEAGSFFTAEGPPPRVAQSFLLIDPAPLAGARFAERVETLCAHVEAQEGARLPGSRRLANRARARAEGVAVPAALLADLERRAAR